jgi:hypothetical protein
VSLPSISQEGHTSSSEDDEPIRSHRYRRIRVERRPSTISSSSSSIATHVPTTERRYSPEEPTFSTTRQPSPTEIKSSDPESSEPESFATFCARRARERARLQLTLPPTTIGLDTRQSVEEFTRPPYPSPSRYSGIVHAVSSPAATSPAGATTTPRSLMAANVSAPVMPGGPLQATSSLNLQTPLEPTQLFTRHRPSIPSTDRTDFVRRLRIAYLTNDDAVMSLIFEEMDTWNR